MNCYESSFWILAASRLNSGSPTGNSIRRWKTAKFRFDPPNGVAIVDGDIVGSDFDAGLAKPISVISPFQQTFGPWHSFIPGNGQPFAPILHIFK